MIDPVLLAEARTWIARLEMCSNGTTTAYDSDGRSSGFDSKPPRSGHSRAPKGDLRMLGSRDPEFLVLRRRLAGCRTDRAITELIAVAKRELEHLQHPPKLTGRDQALLDTEGMTCAAAAVQLGTHLTTVWRWRAKAGRFTTCGHPSSAGMSCIICRDSVGRAMP